MAKVFRGIKELKDRPKKSAVTIGNFDGVHLAHVHLIDLTIRQAAKLNGKSIAYTFYPHPAHVLAPGMGPSLIQTLEDRISLIGELGIDIIVVEPFTPDFASKTFEEFFEKVLCEGLSARSIFVGHDFTFGKDRLGTIDDLRSLGEKKGTDIRAIDAVTIDGILVSSTQIRYLIRSGKMGMAAKLMGRPFRLYGKVVGGTGVGKKIGFPTANLELPDLIVPGRGVYPCRVRWKDKAYRGAVNIGVGPTFEKAEIRKTIEIHILNFAGDLYEEHVEVEFDQDRIRHEIKFSSVDDLRKQISQDIKIVEAIDRRGKNS